MPTPLTDYAKALEAAGVGRKIANAHARALEAVLRSDYKALLETAAAEETSPGKDTKYASYIAVYCNIDTILWKNMSTVAAVTALLFAVVGVLVANPVVSFGPFDHRKTLAVFLAMIGVFYLGAWWNFKRMRFHHTCMGDEIRKLEHDGYFHFRGKESKNTWFEDADWIMRGVLTLAVLSFLSFGYYLVTEDVIPSTCSPSVTQPKS